jgi:hypothetical protein
MDILNQLLGVFGAGLRPVENVSKLKNVNYVGSEHQNCTLTISCRSWIYKQALPTGTLISNDFSKVPYRLYVESVIPGKLKMRINKGAKRKRKGA